MRCLNITHTPTQLGAQASQKLAFLSEALPGLIDCSDFEIELARCYSGICEIDWLLGSNWNDLPSVKPVGDGIDEARFACNDCNTLLMWLLAANPKLRRWEIVFVSIIVGIPNVLETSISCVVRVLLCGFAVFTRQNSRRVFCCEPNAWFQNALVFLFGSALDFYLYSLEWLALQTRLINEAVHYGVCSLQFCFYSSATGYCNLWFWSSFCMLNKNLEKRPQSCLYIQSSMELTIAQAIMKLRSWSLYKWPNPCSLPCTSAPLGWMNQNGATML